MNYYILIPLSSMVINIYLVFFIKLTQKCSNKRCKEITNSFILFVVYAAFWCLFIALLWSGIFKTETFQAIKYSSFLWIFYPFLVLNFVYRYLNRKKDIFYHLSYIFSLTSILLSIFTDGVAAGSTKTVWGYLLIPGKLYPIVIIISGFYPAAVVCIILIKNYRSLNDEKKRKQIQLLLVGMMFSFLLAITTFIIFQSFLKIYSFPTLSASSTTFQSIFSLIAIVKYRFLVPSVSDTIQTLFTQINDGVILFDKNGTVVENNPATIKLLDIKSDNLIDQYYKDILPKPYSFEKEYHNYELKIDNKGEDKFYLLSQDIVVINGENIGKILILKDITEIKKVEIELKKAKDLAEETNRIKSIFLANMGHEIKTPLNGILNFTDIMLKEIGNKRYKNYLNSIESCGKNLLALLNDILDISKIEAGKIDIIYDSVDIKRLISETTVLFEQQAIKKGLNLSLNIAPHIPKYLIIDKLRINQIITNLLSNSLKFTSKGFVTIDIGGKFLKNHFDKYYLKISIKDSGIGIPKDQQKNIFEIFTQMEYQNKREYGGTGLGLAITKKLIDLMDGMISVESEVGKGSCFTIIFPRVGYIFDHSEEKVDNLKNTNPPLYKSYNLPEDIFINKEFDNKDSSKNLEKIKNRLVPLWEVAEKERLIHQFETLSKEIIEISRDENIKFLENWGLELKDAIKMFNIEKVYLMSKNFLKLFE